MRWSEAQLLDFQAKHGLPQEVEPPPGKRAKFGNQKVKTAEGTFDSKGEYQRWCELKMMQKAGQISDLRRQVPFILAPAVTLQGKQKPAMKYLADFVYLQCGKQVVEDFKSWITAEDAYFRAKLHLMKSVHGIEVEVVVNNKKRKQ